MPRIGSAVSLITFYFRALSSGEVRAIGKPEGVPEKLAQMLVIEAARQVDTPGLWQAKMLQADDNTEIELQRFGDEEQPIAVLRARRVLGEVEIDMVWVDGGSSTMLADTKALVSAATHELQNVSDEQWHRLALLL
jgi:hypothetical protein